MHHDDLDDLGPIEPDPPYGSGEPLPPPRYDRDGHPLNRAAYWALIFG